MLVHHIVMPYAKVKRDTLALRELKPRAHAPAIALAASKAHLSLSLLALVNCCPEQVGVNALSVHHVVMAHAEVKDSLALKESKPRTYARAPVNGAPAPELRIEAN